MVNFLLLACLKSRVVLQPSYIFLQYVDADNLLLNPNILWHLISDDVTLVAPMFNTLSAYSNFWCGQDENVSTRSIVLNYFSNHFKLEIMRVAFVVCFC